MKLTIALPVLTLLASTTAQDVWPAPFSDNDCAFNCYVYTWMATYVDQIFTLGDYAGNCTPLFVAEFNTICVGSRGDPCDVPTSAAAREMLAEVCAPYLPASEKVKRESPRDWMV